MIMLQNNIFSFLFPSIADNTTRQTKGILNDTLGTLYARTYTLIAPQISLSAYTFDAHISYIRIIYYLYIIWHTFRHFITAIGVQID